MDNMLISQCVNMRSLGIDNDVSLGLQGTVHVLNLCRGLDLRACGLSDRKHHFW